MALAAFERLPQIGRDYETLGVYPSLRGEIELRIGYLDSAEMNARGALEHLARVPTLTDEADLHYLAQCILGRTYRDMGDRTSARQAFERALAIVPNARSAATQLAAELLISEASADRERAERLLSVAYSDVAPDDPWRLFWHGDARLWPAYMTELREALR